jgi:hypothetical protein
MSDSEYESDAAEELESNGEVLEFGFQDEKKELGGRRLKAHKEQKKKMRPGTFGEPRPRPRAGGALRLPTPPARPRRPAGGPLAACCGSLACGLCSPLQRAGAHTCRRCPPLPQRPWA